MNKLVKIQYLGDFINGHFVFPERSEGNFDDTNPGDLSDKIMTVSYCSEHVERACLAAKRAFKAWSESPFEERKNCLLRLRELYLEYENEMSEAIARDTGKPLWEAIAEAKRLAAKIELTLDLFIHQIEKVQVENALGGISGFLHYKARGVVAIIGAFNRPAALVNEHLIPSLLTGNTVIIKPSELTPFVGQLHAQILEKANFPHGVINLVQGGKEIGKKLVAHECVDGIVFVGSYEVGAQIKQSTVNHYWKILTLEMGGKNGAMVWNDANLDKALYECLVSSFITTGQRSNSTSRLILHEKIYEQFIERFYQAAKKVSIGYWSENPFMGPLISNDAVEKYIRFQEIARREGCESLMRGKALELKHKGYYVTPSITIVEKLNSKSVFQTNEIFGPNVAIYKASDFDQAVEIINATGFGMVASVFTEDRKVFEQSLNAFKVGAINWNRGTTEVSPLLPMAGRDKSGNDRPSGSFSVFSCTAPVACLEDHTTFDPSKLLPGINWD